MNAASAHADPRSISPELIAAARRGDELAWATIFDLLYPRIFRFFRARLGGLQQAEDLASNVFMEAFRSIEKFEWRGKPFEAWMFGIARHELASYYRSRSVAEALPEVAVLDEFLGVEVRDILDRLPRDYRTALELRFVVGLSGIEAAAAMGRSHGSFRSLLLRASRAFRRESEALGPAEPSPLRRALVEMDGVVSAVGRAQDR